MTDIELSSRYDKLENDSPAPSPTQPCLLPLSCLLVPVGTMIFLNCFGAGFRGRK
jgi:hypothetical protein